MVGHHCFKRQQPSGIGNPATQLRLRWTAQAKRGKTKYVECCIGPHGLMQLPCHLPLSLSGPLTACHCSLLLHDSRGVMVCPNPFINKADRV